MSRAGNPYDNAKAERFMRTLKEGRSERQEQMHQSTRLEPRIGAFLETI